MSWVWTIVPWACCREMARVESRQTSLQGARFGGPRCWGMRTVTDSARRRGVAGRAGLCSWTLRSQFYVFLTCHKIVLLFEPFKNAENILCSSAVKRRWQMGWDLWAPWGPPRLGPGRGQRAPEDPGVPDTADLRRCAGSPWLCGGTRSVPVLSAPGCVGRAFPATPTQQQAHVFNVPGERGQVVILSVGPAGRPAAGQHG